MSGLDAQPTPDIGPTAAQQIAAEFETLRNRISVLETALSGAAGQLDIANKREQEAVDLR